MSNDTSYNSHVLCTPVHTWSPRKDSTDETSEHAPVILFDRLHHEVITFYPDKRGSFFVSNKAEGPTATREIALDLHPSVKLEDIVVASLSPDGTYLTCILADREVQIISTATGKSCVSRSCRGQHMWMLDVFWLDQTSLPPRADGALPVLFVTSMGVELYAFKDGDLKDRQTVAFEVGHHWYSSENNILLLVNSESVFQAYQLGKTINKLCIFELDCAGTIFQEHETPDPQAKFHHRQISLLTIYGKMTCVFINERKGQLHLLGLSKDGMEQTHVYDLFLPGKYAISVVDQVLVVHNMRAKMSMLFDIRTDSKSALATPLPLGYRPAGVIDQKAPGDINQEGWRHTLVGSCFLQHSTADRGTLWTMQLDLRQISQSWRLAQQTRLFDFLLKRSTTAAKALVLDILLDFTVKPGTLSLLSRLFNLLNRVCAQQMTPNPAALPTTAESLEASMPKVAQTTVSPSLERGNSTTSSIDIMDRTESVKVVGGARRTLHVRRTSTNRLRAQTKFGMRVAELKVPETPLKFPVDFPASSIQRTTNGYTVISQFDVHQYVFLVAQAQKGCPGSRIISALTEYLRTIYRNNMTPQTFLNDMLVDMLIKENNIYEFHQYLQYHILSDSLEIVDRLLALSVTYVPAFQLAIDMLYRLNEFEMLLHLLLENNQVTTALRLVSPKSPLFTSPNLLPHRFLEAAMKLKDDTAFYWTFRFFQHRNILLRGNKAFVPADQCEKAIEYNQQLLQKAAQNDSDSDSDDEPSPSSSASSEDQNAKPTPAAQAEANAHVETSAEEKTKERLQEDGDEVDMQPGDPNDDVNANATDEEAEDEIMDSIAQVNETEI